MTWLTPRKYRVILPAESLIRTIQQTNNYIAKTHEDDNMFATLFLGILNPITGLLKYINCGHEPPVHCGEWNNEIPIEANRAGCRDDARS